MKASYDSLKEAKAITPKKIKHMINNKILIEGHDLLLRVDGTITPYSVAEFYSYSPFVVAIQRENFSESLIESALNHFEPDRLLKEFTCNYYGSYAANKHLTTYPFPLMESIEQTIENDQSAYLNENIFTIIDKDIIQPSLRLTAKEAQGIIALLDKSLANWNIPTIYKNGRNVISHPLNDTREKRSSLVKKTYNILESTKQSTPQIRDNLYLLLIYPDSQIHFIDEKNKFISPKKNGFYSPEYTSLFLRDHKNNHKWRMVFIHELEHFANDVGFSYGCQDSPIYSLNLRFTSFVSTNQPYEAYQQIYSSFNKDYMFLASVYEAMEARNLILNNVQELVYIKSYISPENFIPLNRRNLDSVSSLTSYGENIEKELERVKFKCYSNDEIPKKPNPKLKDIFEQVREINNVIQYDYPPEAYASEIFARITQFSYSEKLMNLIFPNTYTYYQQWQPCITKAMDQFSNDSSITSADQSFTSYRDLCMFPGETTLIDASVANENIVSNLSNTSEKNMQIAMYATNIALLIVLYNLAKKPCLMLSQWVKKQMASPFSSQKEEVIGNNDLEIEIATTPSPTQLDTESLLTIPLTPSSEPVMRPYTSRHQSNPNYRNRVTESTKGTCLII